MKASFFLTNCALLKNKSNQIGSGENNYVEQGEEFPISFFEGHTEDSIYSSYNI